MNVHFVGIGGVGMAALAVLLKNRGHEVSGCDLAQTPRTRALAAGGIPVSVGHATRHLDGADLVVLTPAVAADSPERMAADRSGVAESRGDVLARVVSEAPFSVAVCGSHGKTTTATFVAKLLLALGEDVEWAIGGETGDFPVAPSRPQDAPPPAVLVVEADESDGTLAHYRTHLLVVNRCEYDHPDHFKTPEAYFACYAEARRNAQETIESESLPDLPELAACLAPLAPHNRRNARAAVEVALRRGHALSAIVAVLPQVVAQLPDRRFQRLADGVYTDYAHHPTEMACAIEMARRVCTGTLRVLFQPHRHSRTKALLHDFPAAFRLADEVVLCPTYAAFEQPCEGGDVADLYKTCRESEIEMGGCRFYLARNCDEAWEHVLNSRRTGDVTLLLGAGDIIRLAPRVASDAVAAPSARRRLWIGLGTNTWRSDLNLNVDYVKSASPAGRPGATLAIPWMAGIPGTIGGWLKMNAGAFGHSIGELVRRVKVDGRWIDRADCGFGYRTSRLEGEIQDVELDFTPPPDGAEQAQAYRARRRQFPAGTWGSFFKNPPGDFAGRLLEAAGAKELSVGGASVWREHANVIVAGAAARPSDVLALARLMHGRVLARFGVSLEPEVRGIIL